MPDTAKYRIRPGSKVKLGKRSTDADGGLEEHDARDRFDKLAKDLQDLQELMYAQGKHSLLVVLQAMDGIGKDSTVRHVFGGLNPAGVRVTSFKAPTHRELSQDFLWRIHQHTPQRGYIHVFNRSHYEDVVTVGVKKLAPPSVWKKRYEHINAFEKMLADEGTTILKFYLHGSKAYQKERLQSRLDNPDKHWKFNPADLAERARWDDYMAAFEKVFERCSTPDAPWFVIPAETRWYRDLVIATILVDTLRSLNMHHPEATFDPKDIVIED